MPLNVSHPHSPPSIFLTTLRSAINIFIIGTCSLSYVSRKMPISSKLPLKKKCIFLILFLLFMAKNIYFLKYTYKIK